MDVDKSPGIFTSEANLTTSDIVGKSAQKKGKLLEIKNGLVVEIRHLSMSDMQCLEDILFVADGTIGFNDCNQESLRKKIGEVCRKAKELKNKKQTKKLDALLNAFFVPPKSKPDMLNTEKLFQNEASKMKRKLDMAEQSYESLDIYTQSLENKLQNLTDECFSISEKYREGISQYAKDDKRMRKEMDAWERKYTEQSAQMDKVMVELGKAKDKLSQNQTRNLNKKIKRRDEKIIVLEEKVNETRVALQDVTQTNNSLQNLIKTTEEDKQILEKNVEDLKHEKLNLMKRVHKLKKKIGIKSDSEVLQQTIDSYESDIKKYQNEISELEKINAYLDSDIIKTYEDGRFVNEVRECCMKLLTECNVSIRKLPVVIETVLHKLTGKMPERLPSQSVLSRLFVEAKIVASHQVATAMLEGHDPSALVGNVLHQDATTKHHKHYEGIQATLKDGQNVSLGLKVVAGGAASDYVMAFQDVIQDLAESLTSEEESINKHRADLITSFKNFMSDQCATNHVFNDQIQTLREELLPLVVDNFSKLSDEEKGRINDMGRFACRLHLLANLASAADKGLIAYESSVCEGNNPFAYNTEGSGTFRLIYTATKSFTQRGCDKSGVNSYFDTFLSGRQQSNHLVPFLGHRFNIAFHDGAALYFHHQDINLFLLNWPNPNNLLKSVHFDVKEKVFVAGARALGILDKLLTGPFQVLMSKEGNIMDLNSHLHEIQIYLTKLIDDGSLALNRGILFQDIPLKEDDLFEYLFREADPELDSLTILALELISAEMLILLERQAATQLPGGKYWQPNEEVLFSASNVPKHNIISERDMAILDNLLKIKPSASPNTIETCVMWAVNKPSQWLSSLTDAEKNTVLDNARTHSKLYRVKIKERQLKLKEHMVQKLKDKQAEKSKQQERQIDGKLKATREIQRYGGVWIKTEIGQNLETLVNEAGNSLPESAIERLKKEAISKQIKFHKLVVLAKGPKILFQETVKGKPYTLEELTMNLETILDLNDHDEQRTEPSSMIYKELGVVTSEIGRQKKSLFTKLNEARHKRQNVQQQEVLPGLIEDPQKLVGRNVLHRCKEDGTVAWFDGKVEAIHIIKTNVIKTEFLIRYVEDPNSLWKFPLLLDLKKGDLILKD